MSGLQVQRASRQLVLLGVPAPAPWEQFSEPQALRLEAPPGEPGELLA